MDQHNFLIILCYFYLPISFSSPLSLSLSLQVGESFLSSVFCVGQLVPCVVLRLDDDKKEKGTRKIWLSLRLSLLHKNFNLEVVQEGMVCHYSMYGIICN